MPIMYQVYSQQRPGRPRWALGSSAILLLLTVGLAAALVQYKSRNEDLPLKQISAAGIQMKLPADWKIVSPGNEESPQGTLAVASEPASKGSPGRHVLIFTAQPYPLGNRMMYGKVVGLKYVAELNRGMGLATMEGDNDTSRDLAGLPAVTVEAVGHSPSRKGFATYCLARVAVSPDGYVIGAAVLSRDARRLTAIRLLDRISQGIELPGAKPVGDPAAAMKAAGIVFRLPVGSKIIEPAVANLPRLMLAGGGDGDSWVIEAARTPLIGSRTPDRLLEDYALSVLQQPGLQDTIASVDLNGRKAFHIELRSEKSASILAWCVQTAPDTALLLVGRFDGEAGKTVDGICRSIAASAEVAPYQQAMDIPKALTAGRGWMGRVTGDGMERVWGPLQEERQTYLHEVPGLAFLRATTTYDRDRPGGKWQIRDRTYAIDEGHSSRLLQSDETWEVQDKSNGFDYKYTRNDPAGRVEFTYSESRAPGAGQVKRSLTVPNSGKRQGAVNVDEHYGCEPVLLAAGGRIAVDARRSSAVFMATETFPSETVYWTMIPLGQRAVPWDPNGAKVAAVCLQRDYDPSPIVLYYEPDGVLLGVGFEGEGWRRLVKAGGGEATR